MKTNHTHALLMKHTLLAGLAALITATTRLGAEPMSPTPAPDTSRAVRLQNLGKEFITNAKFGIFVHYTVSLPADDSVNCRCREIEAQGQIHQAGNAGRIPQAAGAQARDGFRG